MRLLDVHEFPPAPPEDIHKRRPYAILSHVWQEDELVFADLQRGSLRADCEKITGAQRQARADGLSYLWIDTLCIDKSSSSELGEAINSMYKWYQQAAVCYVYLADLDGCPPLTDATALSGETADERYWGVLFRESKWFRRGWTLQELIAPYKLRFYDRSWNFIGTLDDLAATVSETTNVHLSMLRHEQRPEDFSIAQRMSWAANRQTTRSEDRAYSLLGILNITISIRYGESSQAFIRLQEAIIARDADQSVFAWETPIGDEDVHLKERRNSYLWYDPEWSQLLAPSPDAFAGSRNIVPSIHSSLPYRMTNLGLYITSDVPDHGEESIILNCHFSDDPTKAILLNIRHHETLTIRREEAQGLLPPETVAHVFLRGRSTETRVRSRLSLMDVDQARLNAKPQTFYISRYFAPPEDGPKPCKVWLQFLDECDETLKEMQPAVASKVDFVTPPPKLHFESSSPPIDSTPSNLTWTFSEEEDGTSSPSQIVMARLGYTGTAEGAVELGFQLSIKRAFLSLSIPRLERGGEQPVSLADGAKRGITKPIQTQILPEPGHAIRASLQRQRFNGQDIYVIKVCSVRTRVPRWRLKRGWDWRRKTSLKTESGCTPTHGRSRVGTESVSFARAEKI